MSNPPRWLSMAKAILDHAACENARSDRSNATTRRITENVIRTLLQGQPLTKALAKAFVQNIRIRTGNVGFVWDDEIKLTRDQRINGLKKFPQYAPQAPANTTPPGIGYVTQERHDELATRVAFLEELVLQRATEAYQLPT